MKQIAVVYLPNGRYSAKWKGYYLTIRNKVYPTFVREKSGGSKNVRVTVMNRRVYYA